MMNLATWMNWVADGSHRLLAAAVVTLAFAILARLIRGVSRTGAVAGAAVSFILYASIGAGAFAALVSVFILAWLTTRLGYAHKQKHGTAEKSGGRTGSQVLANLSVATAAALLYYYHGSALYVSAMAAALGEAAADTVSSEYGQARSKKALLITTWQQVPAGTDGGITAAGTIAGILGAAIVSVVCIAVRLLDWHKCWIPTSAAIFGMLVDSLLGASLERTKILNNDAVNFLSTLAAAATAAVLFRIVR